MEDKEQDKKISDNSAVEGVEFLDVTEAEIEKEISEQKKEIPTEELKHEIIAGIEFDESVVTQEPNEKKEVDKVETIDSVQQNIKPVQQNAKTEDGPSHVHTFSEDIAKAVRVGGGKTLRDAISETDEQNIKVKMKSEKRLALSLVTIILFVAGILVILFFAQPKEPPVYIESLSNIPKAMISSENTHQIDVTDKGRINIINEIISTYLKDTNLHTVANIYFVKQTSLNKTQLTTNEFLSIIRSTAPATLLSSLDQKFMFGTYVGENTTPFLVIKGNSFDSLSNGLTGWESSMLSDLHQIFKIEQVGSDNVFGKRFENIVVTNKDGRVVYDSENNPVFMYVFMDDTTVIFSTDIPTITEIIRRYISPIH